MYPQSTNHAVHVQPETLTEERVRELRLAPEAREVGYGWLRIAPKHSPSDCVLLVSISTPVCVTFVHGLENLDQMRASMRAAGYASRNPHRNCDDDKDGAETDGIPGSTST